MDRIVIAGATFLNQSLRVQLFMTVIASAARQFLDGIPMLFSRLPRCARNDRQIEIAPYLGMTVLF